MVQAAIKKSLNLGMKRPPNFSGKDDRARRKAERQG
jgi:hypothetical protein